MLQQLSMKEKSIKDQKITTNDEIILKSYTQYDPKKPTTDNKKHDRCKTHTEITIMNAF